MVINFDRLDICNFFFSSRRRHTRSTRDWSSDVCSSDLESESFSPLALGFSMTIDYKKHELTIGRHLPPEPKDFELPLRLYRLATVRGVVDRNFQANFVIDTGGEVISISQATATELGRRDGGRKIALKVYGTAGWGP